MYVDTRFELMAVVRNNYTSSKTSIFHITKPIAGYEQRITVTLVTSGWGSHLGCFDPSLNLFSRKSRYIHSYKTTYNPTHTSLARVIVFPDQPACTYETNTVRDSKINKMYMVGAGNFGRKFRATISDSPIS